MTQNHLSSPPHLPNPCPFYRGGTAKHHPKGHFPGMTSWHQDPWASVTTLAAWCFLEKPYSVIIVSQVATSLLQVTTWTDCHQGEILLSFPPSQGLGTIYQDSPPRDSAFPQISTGPRTVPSDSTPAYSFSAGERGGPRALPAARRA